MRGLLSRDGIRAPWRPEFRQRASGRRDRGACGSADRARPLGATRSHRGRARWVDPARTDPRLSEAPVTWSELTPLLPEIFAHLEAEAPNEGCGVVLHRVASRYRPMKNVAPADSSRAFSFDLREQLRVERDAEAAGESVACIVHSHVEGPATLSAEDRRSAVVAGTPLHPG